MRLRHKDGTTTWVKLDSNTSQESYDAFLQRIVLTDITATKAAESALRASEEFHVAYLTPCQSTSPFLTRME